MTLSNPLVSTSQVLGLQMYATSCPNAHHNDKPYNSIHLLSEKDCSQILGLGGCPPGLWAPHRLFQQLPESSWGGAIFQAFVFPLFDFEKLNVLPAT